MRWVKCYVSELSVSMAILWAGTTPASSCRLARSHWTRSVEKYSPDPSYLPKTFETSEGEGRVGTQIAAPLQIYLQRSAWIRKDLLKQMLNDPLWSAKICKDLQQEQQLICKGSYKPRAVIRYDQQNQTIRKHASKESHQWREVPNPCDHPASRHKGFGVIRWPHKTQPTTSIGSILTLPTLHLVTLKSYAKVHQSFKKISWTHWLVCCYFSFFPSLIPNFLGIPHTTEIIIGLISSCVEKCNQKDWFL